ncbi:4'-phosphopantetheinyl transferase [Alcanivoracaceae bacterium MT1]
MQCERAPSFFCTPLEVHWPLPVALAGVRLCSTHFDPAQLHPEDFALAGVQPPANILRAEPERQAEFLAGRICARGALMALNGQPDCPAVGEDRSPIWPSAISGSITHGDCWAAALAAANSDWQGLGLDVESLLSPERARCLSDRILTANERLRFAADLEERTGQLVTLAFSLKESLFNALYPLVGGRLHFEHAELLEWHPSGLARLRLLIDLSEDWRHGHELDAQFALFDDRLLSLVAVAA